MTVPYDCDQTNIDHLRAVIAEQEQTIKYLHEHCKAEEVENAKLRELVRDIYGEYRYLRVRFHRIYVHHEERMRAIEQRMRDLRVEVDA